MKLPQLQTKTLKTKAALIFFTLGCLSALAANASGDPGDFGWKERSFSGNTNYSIVKHDGDNVVQATADGTASALYKNRKVDLRKTPFLRWRWKISNTFNNPNEQTKQGDDFPARVYVVYRKGLLPFNTLAINYVWASSNPVNTHWKSAYTENSQMIVVRSGDQQAGEWVLEKRDVAADFKQFFGVNVAKINGIAVMVDGDNTQSSTTSWFSHIDFSAD